ncbi:MAG: hypothetical protein KDA28_15980, partial [Phycisphaerales bacterium]|nr:hypothetical protein [Phycisphaerales bacterium]
MLKTLLICMVLLGVQPTTDDQSAPPQPQRLTEIRNAVAAADETIQQQAASSIEAATKFMERAATAEKSTAQSDAEIQNAPTRLETIRQELTARLPDPEPIPDTETPAQIEARLTQAKARLDADRQKATELAGEDTRRERRSTEINEANRLAQIRLEELDDVLIAQAENEPDLVFQARQFAHRAEIYALRKEIEAGNKEIA